MNETERAGSGRNTGLPDWCGGLMTCGSQDSSVVERKMAPNCR